MKTWNLESSQQILKIRNDHDPVIFEPLKELEDESPKFSTSAQHSWAKNFDFLRPTDFRSYIEPWLTALCQSEYLSLLVGSGLSRGVFKMATGDDMYDLNSITFESFGSSITSASNSNASTIGRGEGNFEDRIRVACELYRGLQILANDSCGRIVNEHKDSIIQLEEEIELALKTIAQSILKDEHKVIASNTESVTALNYLVSFIMSFASRSGTRDRLNIFTTNYDRFIELGADLAGLRLINRFIGTLEPVFRSSRLDIDLHYNPPGIRGEPRYLEGVIRFAKLHGSIDWINRDQYIYKIGLPFGGKSIMNDTEEAKLDEKEIGNMMIYPNAAKDWETTGYPYVELFRDFASAICRPNSTLVCFGYSFGDDHINRVIEDMLTISSTHLIIISFSDPLNRIQSLFEKLGRNSQVSLLVGNHFADLSYLVDYYLPKPSIDLATRRMTELLKDRLVSKDDGSEDTSSRNSDNSNGG